MNLPFTLSHLRSITMFVVFFQCVVGVAHAQRKQTSSETMPVAVKTSPAKSADRSFIGLLIASGWGEMFVHTEFNVAKEVGLGLEYGHLPASEYMSDRAVKETGESLVTRGQEFILTLSNYSRPQALGGFFWTLGAGYQTVDTIWKKRPEPNESSAGRTALLDRDGKMQHSLKASGVTAHGRLGYRYVAETWPFAIGGFLSLKHFQGKFDDDERQAPSDSQEYRITKTTPEERKTAQHRNMTLGGLGLEVGLAF